MKRLWSCLALMAPFGALWACTEDDDVGGHVEAGAPDGSSTLDSSADGRSDGGSARACGDAGAAPRRVLLIQGTPNGSELAAVNLETKTVDGHLAFDAGYGMTSSVGSDPYLLDEENDVVTRLDPNEPWKAVAAWNVRGDDRKDGADPNANPVAVVQASCTKAYVLRYNRDRIAIIDPSESSGGAPTGFIDLAPLKQAGDPNMVEMTSAVFVPSKRRVYVLLGNADFTRVHTSGGITKLVCTSTLVPSIIAIDVDTDAIVDLGGTAPGGGIALSGYNPTLGTPLVYDAVLDRLLVLEAGCNEESMDGGAGPAVLRRRVEQVDLATGAVTTLLPLESNGFPSSLAFASGEHAALAFFFDGYLWDPRQKTLGPAIEDGMDLVASDGRGAFVGTRQVYLDDGGTGPLQVVAIPASDTRPVPIVDNPFAKAGGYVAGIEVWPQR